MKCLRSEIRNFRKNVSVRYARLQQGVARFYSSAITCRLCRSFVIEGCSFVLVSWSIQAVRKKRLSGTSPAFPRQTINSIIQTEDLALANIVTFQQVPPNKFLRGQKKKLSTLNWNVGENGWETCGYALGLSTPAGWSSRNVIHV